MSKRKIYILNVNPSNSINNSKEWVKQNTKSRIRFSENDIYEMIGDNSKSTEKIMLTIRNTFLDYAMYYGFNIILIPSKKLTIKYVEDISNIVINYNYSEKYKYYQYEIAFIN